MLCALADLAGQHPQGLSSPVQGTARTHSHTQQRRPHLAHRSASGLSQLGERSRRIRAGCTQHKPPISSNHRPEAARLILVGGPRCSLPARLWGSRLG